jgi:hypothetical protein
MQVTLLEIKGQKDHKKDEEAQNAEPCSNPSCRHRGDEHYSPLHPKSSGDPLDRSCRLCNCEKFQ